MTEQILRMTHENHKMIDYYCKMTDKNHKITDKKQNMTEHRSKRLNTVTKWMSILAK
jgi:hypothetical protein